jgi:hypothetical protein
MATSKLEGHHVATVNDAILLVEQRGILSISEDKCVSLSLTCGLRCLCSGVTWFTALLASAVLACRPR